MNSDGTGLTRLPNTGPSDRPRYWTVDGDWIVAVSEDNALYAVEAEGDRRLPLASLVEVQFYDQRYHPWRILDQVRCDNLEESWWRCK
jgi:hypothetical protein